MGIVGARNTTEVRNIYDRAARSWRWISIPAAICGFNRLRKKHFKGVTGDVLDVACGTGENFNYLRGARSVTATDLSSEMAVRARDRARRIGLDVKISVGDAAVLPYEDGSFDTVVSAGSSCTFPDHVAAFKEMERVVKPDGHILLVEHSRSSVGWIARHQDRSVERVCKRWGCRINRDVAGEIAEAGLRVVSHERSHLGMLNRVEIEPRQRSVPRGTT
jgi:ubiquinone/menaquinone biosynthesis C-methylase UbiE